MFDRLGEVVPKDELIANNSWDGSGFAYALTGRRVLNPHQLSTLTPQAEAFLNGFAGARPNSPSCRAADTLDLKWVLDFAAPAGLGYGAQQFDGLQNLDNSENVELVERIGTASLYRIVGC